MSGADARRLRRYSHWLAKLFASVVARSSASMRSTCARSSAGLAQACRRPRPSTSSSSGRLLHKKNDNRVASSTSPTLI